jgi:hypothetical protein
MRVPVPPSRLTPSSIAADRCGSIGMSMTTLEFVSTSADGLSESATPLVSAAALLTGPGTHPTVTLPVVPGRAPDTEAVWRWLAEPADFFGIEMPTIAHLRRALTDFTDELQRRHGPRTAVVTVVVVDAHVVVSGAPISPVRTEPVHLARCAMAPPMPSWRQMAARTTSRAAQLRTERELAGCGHADAVPADSGHLGVPLLGALVCDTPGGRVGLGAARLGRLRAAGLLDTSTTLTDAPLEPAAVTRAWWVSPRYETHPVASIGELRW